MRNWIASENEKKFFTLVILLLLFGSLFFPFFHFDFHTLSFGVTRKSNLCTCSLSLSLSYSAILRVFFPFQIWQNRTMGLSRRSCSHAVHLKFQPEIIIHAASIDQLLKGLQLFLSRNRFEEHAPTHIRIHHRPYTWYTHSLPPSCLKKRIQEKKYS